MKYFEERKELKKKIEEYTDVVRSSLINDYDIKPSLADLLIDKFDVAKFIKRKPKMLNLEPKEFARHIIRALADMLDYFAED